MTISSVTNKNQYNGNGSTTTFTYSFRIIQNVDIRVVLTDTTTGIDTVQVLGTNYTVTGVNADAGGTVVFSVAPTATQRVTLMRSAQAIQPEHYVENDPFPADSHELALDRVTTVAQTNQEVASRSVQVGYGTNLSTFNPLLPPVTTAAAGQSILVKPDLSGFSYGSATYVTGPGSSTDKAVVRWNGTTGQLIQNSNVIIDDSGNITGTSFSGTTVNSVNETVTGTLTASTGDITTVNSSVVSSATINATGTITGGALSTAGTVTANTVTASNYGTVTSSTINNSGTVTSANANITNLTAQQIDADNVNIHPLAGSPSILKLYDHNGVQYVAFRAPLNVTTSTIYNLPPSDGFPNQVLTTDGVGNLSWQTGVAQQPFLGTLATLADVSFSGLAPGDIFMTPNGSVWSNPLPGVGSGVQPYNVNISFTNVAETRSQQIDMAGNQILRPLLENYSESVTTVSTTPTTTIDISTANMFEVDQATDTSLVFANPSASGTVCSFVLLRKKDNTATARAVVWPATVKWAQGVAPTLTQTANAVDAFMFRTFDGGASYLGYPATLDFA